MFLFCGEWFGKVVLRNGPQAAKGWGQNVHEQDRRIIVDWVVYIVWHANKLSHMCRNPLQAFNKKIQSHFSWTHLTVFFPPASLAISLVIAHQRELNVLSVSRSTVGTAVRIINVSVDNVPALIVWPPLCREKAASSRTGRGRRFRPTGVNHTTQWIMRLSGLIFQQVNQVTLWFCGSVEAVISSQTLFVMSLLSFYVRGASCIQTL